MFLGGLSVLQAVFLPGYLALRLSRWRAGSVLEASVVILALSLLFNYLTVYLLTALGVYDRTTALGLHVVQLVTALVFLAHDARHRIRRELRVQVPLLTREWAPTALVVLAAASVVIATVAALRASFQLNVFNAWDALFSWNKWAYDWSAGELPQFTALYPQLIPANWSLMYLITGSPELQAFPLGIMPLFGIGILVMFLDLALRKRRAEYLIALVLCASAAFIFRGTLFDPVVSQIGGYVDIAVAFYFAAALYVIELREPRLPDDWRQLVLPLLMASAAAVTKANGFYVFGVILLLGLTGHLRAHGPRLGPGWPGSGILTVLVTLAIPVSWYGLKLADFLAGRDGSNHAALREAVDAASGTGGVIDRLVHALSVIPGPLPVTVVAIIVVAVAGIIAPRARWMTLGVLFPYSTLWALYLSYDIRNLLVMLPVAAYVLAFGASAALGRAAGVSMHLGVYEKRILMPRYTGVLALSGFVLACALFALLYPTSRAVADSLDRQRHIGDAEFNAFLYDRFARYPDLRGDVLTDYGYMQFLPGFRSDPIRLASTSRTRVAWMYHGAIDPQSLEGQDVLVLAENLVSPEVRDLMDRRLSRGQYTLVDEFSSGPFLSYEESVTIRLIRVNR